MTSALLQSHDMFGPGPFGTHAYAAASVAAAGSDVGAAAAAAARPSSPPQPVPRPRQNFGTCTVWEDASAHNIPASPCSSDATEQFLDCYSDVPSAASSYDAESSTVEELQQLLAWGLPSQRHPIASNAELPALQQQQMQEERQSRLAAEAVAAELQQQLHEISSLLFAYRRGQQQQQDQLAVRPVLHAASDSRSGCSGSGGDSSSGSSNLSVAAELEAVLHEVAAAEQAAAKEAAAQCRRAELAEAAVAAGEDAALVARMVAGMCARAVVAADLRAAWAAERAVLERRLEQAARMGQAMLKHQKENRPEPEPWRQQLLNTAVSVSCFLLGATAAVLLIRRSQQG